MIDPLVLLTYVAVVAGFVFIPGPATLLTVARATSSGTRAGLATAIGIAAGDVIHTAMAIIGLSAVIYASAFAFSVIKYLGAAYLIWLGLRALFSATGAGNDTPQRPITPRQAFRQAIIAEVLNPKTALFFVAFLPQFVDPARGAVMFQLAVFGLVLVGLGLASTVFFALTAGQIGHILRHNQTVRTWQNRVVGAIYVGLGVRLALQER